MKCDDVRRLLEAYHDGELDLERSLEIERHLTACENCTNALQNLRAIREAVAPARFSAPEDLRAGLLANLRMPSARPAKTHSA